MSYRQSRAPLAWRLHTRHVAEVKRNDLAHLLGKCQRAESIERKRRERERGAQ